MTDTKRCTRCGEFKALSEYHRDRTRADGLRSACKPCSNAALRARRRKQRHGVDTSRGRHNETRAWVCERDPQELYEDGGFSRMDFAGTLGVGYWPDGSIWRGAPRRGEDEALWRIEGDRAYEIGGSRVLTVTRAYSASPVIRVEEATR